MHRNSTGNARCLVEPSRHRSSRVNRGGGGDGKSGASVEAGRLELGVICVHKRRVGNHTDVSFCEALVAPKLFDGEGGHVVGLEFGRQLGIDVSLCYELFNGLEGEAAVLLEIRLGTASSRVRYWNLDWKLSDLQTLNPILMPYRLPRYRLYKT